MTGTRFLQNASFCLRLVLMLAVAATSLSPSAAQAAKKASSAAAPNHKYAAIVIDADTGAILFERYADKSVHPASLVKMMTLLMAFEALERGGLRLRDPVPISRHAASMPPSKLNLPAGSSIKVEDAIYALVTKSANDIAAALGEKIGGTESQFAALMTRRAAQIGMNHSRFMNASGLHHPSQVTSARDMAKLASYIMTNYPQYYHYFSTRNFSYRGVNYHNHNRLMETYKGMDGFKTGYIVPSGFNLVASAKRGDKRLIAAVFGGRSAATRNTHMAQILDDGFAKLGRGGTSTLVAQNDNNRNAAGMPLPQRKPGSQTASLQPQPFATARVLTQPQPTPQQQPIQPSITSFSAPSALAPAQPSPSSSIITLSRVSPRTPDGQQVSPYVPPSYQQQPASQQVDASGFSEMIGEGDYDPAVKKRLETGLMAIASVRGHEGSAAQAPQPQRPVGLQDTRLTGQGTPDAGQWAVQIGAYSSRVQTDQALQQALGKLPPDLRQASAIIVPLKTGEGWLFRGRLSGFSKNEALRACKHLKECLPVSPQAY